MTDWVPIIFIDRLSTLGVPLALYTVFAAALLLGFFSVKSFYADKVQFLQKQVSNFQSATKSSTPEDAKSRLRKLEVEVHNIDPQALTIEQTIQLGARLDRCPGLVTFNADMKAIDVGALKAQFYKVFRKSGWDVRLCHLSEGQEPAKGGVLLRLPARFELTDEAVAVGEALQAAGISFDTELVPFTLDKQNPVRPHPELVFTAPSAGDGALPRPAANTNAPHAHSQDLAS